jgi:hypothetical protein
MMELAHQSATTVWLGFTLILPGILFVMPALPERSLPQLVRPLATIVLPVSSWTTMVLRAAILVLAVSTRRILVRHLA